MNTEQKLLERSRSKCELCGSELNLSVYEVPPASDASAEQCILVCEICQEQIDNPANMDVSHWRGLSDSMWNPEPAVQAMVANT